jgi:hypothetical protein
MKPFSLVDRQSHNRTREGQSLTENHPLSPPDTEISSQIDIRRPSLAQSDRTFTLPAIPATPEIQRESAGARFRRVAGIPTTQSGSREFRGASRPQTRWLLVLMPPAHLTTELSVGHRSPGRIVDGLLIPLFPTVSHFHSVSALTQILRSFLPSLQRLRKSSVSLAPLVYVSIFIFQMHPPPLASQTTHGPCFGAAISTLTIQPSPSAFPSPAVSNLTLMSLMHAGTRCGSPMSRARS